MEARGIAGVAFDRDGDTFEADINSYAGGQCLGCPFSPPDATGYGTITVTFSDSE